jgi:hypothetical protein
MEKLIKNRKAIFCSTVLGVLLTSSAALALQIDWPNSPMPPGMSLGENSKLPDLIKYLYEWGIALGGLVAFVALLTAGIEFLTSTGNATKMAGAKDRIMSAVIGLTLLLSSWLILNTINPELTTFKPLVMPAPEDLLGNCEYYYEIDTQTGEKKEPPIYREDPQQYCAENFGEDYKCENNVCSMNLWEFFTVEECTSVVITSEDKVATLKEGEARKKNWDDGTPLLIEKESNFQIEAFPYKCMSTLVLTEDQWAGGCRGDKRTLAIQPGVVSYFGEGVPEGYSVLESNFNLDMNVECFKLEDL